MALSPAQRAIRFQVQRHLEEFTCDCCCQPVYVGEPGWEEEGRLYCSPVCAREDRSERADFAEAYAGILADDDYPD